MLRTLHFGRKVWCKNFRLPERLELFTAHLCELVEGGGGYLHFCFLRKNISTCVYFFFLVFGRVFWTVF